MKLLQSPPGSTFTFQGCHDTLLARESPIFGLFPKADFLETPQKEKPVAVTDPSRLSRGRQFIGNIQHYPDSSSLDPDANLASVHSEDLSAYGFHNGNALASNIDNWTDVPKHHLIFIHHLTVETNFKG